MQLPCMKAPRDSYGQWLIALTHFENLEVPTRITVVRSNGYHRSSDNSVDLQQDATLQVVSH